MQLFTRQMIMKFTSPWKKQTVNQQVNKQEKIDDSKNSLPLLMAESEEELKSLLMRVKEESERAGLRLNIKKKKKKKAKIMAPGPITAWQIEGGKLEVAADFLFLGSKITADRECSHEIRKRWLLGRKAVRNLDSVLKSRDITLPTKVRIVKAMVFPIGHVQL